MKNFIIFVLMCIVIGLSTKLISIENQNGLTLDDDGLNLNTDGLNVIIDNDGIRWKEK